ncbi:hypothetical protein [Nocardia sp. NPDC057030]
MTAGPHTIVYPVTDLVKAKSLLNARAHAEPTTPHHIGYRSAA